MKTTPHSNPVFLKTIILIACFILVMLYNQSRAAGTNLPADKRTAVNFRNDAGKNELAIRVKSSKEALQLFLFSPDGILIEKVSVYTNKTTIIKGLKKGYYLFECFNNDERMKSGSIVIK